MQAVGIVKMIPLSERKFVQLDLNLVLRARSYDLNDGHKLSGLAGEDIVGR